MPQTKSIKFLAAQGRRHLVVGATKRTGLSPEDALRVRRLWPLAVSSFCSSVTCLCDGRFTLVCNMLLFQPKQYSIHPPWLLTLAVNAKFSPGRAQACGRPVEDPSDIAEARQALLPPACELWPPLCDWTVTGVRSGVRALPCRTPQGAMPYAGRVDGGGDDRRCEQFWGDVEFETQNGNAIRWRRVCCDRCKVSFMTSTADAGAALL